MPHDEAAWRAALPHRSGDAFTAAVVRLEAAGVTPSLAESVLGDLGEGLWTGSVDGVLGDAAARAVVLGELAAFLAAAVERTAHLRRTALEELATVRSLSDIARQLGVSPQAVHKTLRVRPDPAASRPLLAFAPEDS
ncbi:hypothetical protein [Cellulomonas carbonis]|uniref:Uncharacterized protein n=1 Tax=Cellulomonas carbonis T26 TaxID=947969 RepID=A0A0A0BJB3_9CELL|nr:hypothetical protein [Cellulomonas carbonis]KGM08603.1 hypothetical protein N868_08005 [Cellulomonas carbonis T26]GGC13683.1 hypothetical protein GCM10010972_28760 [Cellulomonas carbonis]